MRLFCSANNTPRQPNTCPDVFFQRTGQEIGCPTLKFPYRETFCSGLSACHSICSSQKSLTAAPVSFCQLPHFETASSALCSDTLLPPAGCFCYPLCYALKTPRFTERSTMLAFSISIAGKNPPAANICARHAKPPAA